MYERHLSATEINIIGGALDLSNKTAGHAMTLLDKVNMAGSGIQNSETQSIMIPIKYGHLRATCQPQRFATLVELTNKTVAHARNPLVKASCAEQAI